MIQILNTLRKELLAGYAEVVKYSLINDRVFNWLNKNTKDNLSLVLKYFKNYINLCKKAEIVKLDEKEKTRMLLNLERTFAHALESELNYKVGYEAVSLVY